MNVATSTAARPQQQPVYWQISGALHPGEPPQKVVLRTNRFRIGRRPGLDMSLPSMQISGLHAELVQVGGRVFIRDLNSTNGTYVNGRRINHQDTPLRDGDRIRLGTLEFRLERHWVDKSAAETAVGSLADTAKGFQLTDAPTRQTAPNVERLENLPNPSDEVVLDEEDCSDPYDEVVLEDGELLDPFDVVPNPDDNLPKTTEVRMI